MCAPGKDSFSRVVNVALVHSACYAQQANVSAVCQEQMAIFDETSKVESSRGNFFGNYPNLYFSTMNLFATSNVQTSVVIMRTFNLLLFISLISALWLLLPRVLKPTLYFAVVLTIVPLGLFLIPSINPSSWAIIGSLIATISTLGALNQTGKSKYALWALSVLGLTLAASSRYDGLLYALLGFIAAFIVAKSFKIPKKIFWFSAITLTALTLIAFAFGATSIIQKLTGLAGSSGSNADSGTLGILANNIATLPQLWAGFSGAMGIGWLDTLLPITSWMLAAFVVWSTLFSRLSQISGKQLWLSLLLATLLAVTPLLVLQASMAVVGENVQSRYLYPLFLVTVAIFLYRDNKQSTFFNIVQIWVITLSLLASNTLALFTNFSRYINGSGTPGFSPNLNIAAQEGWWWPAGPQPMTVFFLGMLGFGVFLSTAFLFRQNSPYSDEQFEPKVAVAK